MLKYEKTAPVVRAICAIYDGFPGHDVVADHSFALHCLYRLPNMNMGRVMERLAAELDRMLRAARTVAYCRALQEITAYPDAYHALYRAIEGEIKPQNQPQPEPPK